MIFGIVKVEENVLAPDGIRFSGHWWRGKMAFNWKQGWTIWNLRSCAGQEREREKTGSCRRRCKVAD